MEIIVKGTGTEYFVPNEVILNINFITKGLTYEEVLRKGPEDVQNFVNELLLKNGFQKEDMKTRSYVIREENKYNETTRNYDPDGYSFNQKATLKFDYNKELLAKIMVDLSELDSDLTCQINFGVKNERECKRKILSIAYKDAEAQALAIAEASGKTLKCCQKVDFEPFTTTYVSDAKFNSNSGVADYALRDSIKNIINTFTPEDIKLSETLYCLWIAE